MAIEIVDFPIKNCDFPKLFWHNQKVLEILQINIIHQSHFQWDSLWPVHTVIVEDKNVIEIHSSPEIDCHFGSEHVFPFGNLMCIYKYIRAIQTEIELIYIPIKHGGFP